MRCFVLDLDDCLAWTTRDLRGEASRIPHITLVPGALEFLKIHKRRCILLTAGDIDEQRQKIKVLGIRKCFKQTYIVPRPEDKPYVLEQIVKASWIKPLGFVVIGDRLDTEIRKGNQLGCTTVRIKLPGGRHSDKMALGAYYEVPTYEAKDFEELMEKFPVFAS